jgi:hypothetical protein
MNGIKNGGKDKMDDDEQFWEENGGWDNDNFEDDLDNGKKNKQHKGRPNHLG